MSLQNLMGALLFFVGFIMILVSLLQTFSVIMVLPGGVALICVFGLGFILCITGFVMVSRDLRNTSSQYR